MLSFSFRLAETWKTNRSRLNIMDLMGILQFLFIYLQMTSPSWPPSQWGVAAACHPAWCSRTSSWRSSGPLVGHSPGSGPSCPSPCFQTENIFILQQFSKHWITSRVWSINLVIDFYGIFIVSLLLFYAVFYVFFHLVLCICPSRGLQTSLYMLWYVALVHVIYLSIKI